VKVRLAKQAAEFTIGKTSSQVGVLQKNGEIMKYLLTTINGNRTD
jgi:hypothetical protein